MTPNRLSGTRYPCISFMYVTIYQKVGLLQILCVWCNVLDFFQLFMMLGSQAFLTCTIQVQGGPLCLYEFHCLGLRNTNVNCWIWSTRLQILSHEKLDVLEILFRYFRDPLRIEVSHNQRMLVCTWNTFMWGLIQLLLCLDFEELPWMQLSQNLWLIILRVKREVILPNLASSYNPGTGWAGFLSFETWLMMKWKLESGFLATKPLIWAKICI